MRCSRARADVRKRRDPRAYAWPQSVAPGSLWQAFRKCHSERSREWFAAMKAVASDDASVHDLMPDIDRSLLRENLKLSFEERARKHLRVFANGGRTAARRQKAATKERWPLISRRSFLRLSEQRWI